MTSLAHPGIDRVATLLRAAGHQGEVRLLPDACRTAVEAPIVFIDRDLQRYHPIWAAAGHPHAVFPLGSTISSA